MSAKRNTIRYGIAAVLTAAAIIAASMVFSPTLAQLTGTGPTGTLAVQITDPPNVPPGVSAVYITYSAIQVHVEQDGNQSGWYSVSQSGSVNLMSIVNVAMTAGNAKVPSGVYNLVRFDITSATVTYNGKNYTAFVPSNEMTIPIDGGASVQSGTDSGFVIDLSPTVVPYQNGNSVGFVLVPAARSIPVPPLDWHHDDDSIGTRSDLTHATWYHDSEAEVSGNVSIVSASLSNTTLSLVVKNTGSTNVTLMEASVLANSSTTDGLESVVAYQVIANGSLVLHAEDMQTGYVLQSGQQVTLTASIPTISTDTGHEGTFVTTSVVTPGSIYTISVSGLYDVGAHTTTTATS